MIRCLSLEDAMEIITALSIESFRNKITMNSDFYMIDFGNFLKFQDMDSLEWIEIRSEGSIPSPRWGHSCVPYRDSLYIFG